MRIIEPMAHLFCEECETRNIRLIRFDDTNMDWEVSMICATCLRAALEMLEKGDGSAPQRNAG